MKRRGPNLANLGMLDQSGMNSHIRSPRITRPTRPTQCKHNHPKHPLTAQKHAPPTTQINSAFVPFDRFVYVLDQACVVEDPPFDHYYGQGCGSRVCQGGCPALSNLFWVLQRSRPLPRHKMRGPILSLGRSVKGNPHQSVAAL